MKSAGVRDVKNRISYYLRMVSQGETVLVTDRGEVVAQLAPPPHATWPSIDSDEFALSQLARLGRLRQGRSVLSVGQVSLPSPNVTIDLAAMLDQIRSDRI